MDSNARLCFTTYNLPIVLWQEYVGHQKFHQVTKTEHKNVILLLKNIFQKIIWHFLNFDIPVYTVLD